jgi:Transglutaminase-like superfamily
MTRCLLALLLALLSLRPVDAEQLKSKLGFFIDMPSGFGLKNGDGATRYAFTDPEGGMEYDILAYEPGRFADAPELASQTLGKLGSSGGSTPYSYEGRKAVLAELGFALNGARQKGYGLFIEGRKIAGGKGAIDEYSYALLAYAPESDFEAYSDFILSCLDSFSVDAAARRSPGPVSQFTLDWPPTRDKERLVSLAGGGHASLPWAETEAEQEAQTDTREYKVLTAYANEPALSQDAWARFYRMAYRESAARLDRLALETSKTIPPDDPTEAARKILAWVQGFVYERDEKGSDFIPPLTAAYGATGDCDSRAVVAAIILRRLGIDAILMVSREYSHAMLGVDVPGGGQRFDFNGKRYLVGETTAKIGMGTIAADMADWTKWMGIDLGN